MGVYERIYAPLPACLLYPYYKENLWLNSGVISRAMFARALKEIRDNDVFLTTGARAASILASGTVTNWEGCSEAGGRLSVLGTVARAADFDLFAL